MLNIFSSLLHFVFLLVWLFSFRPIFLEWVLVSTIFPSANLCCYDESIPFFDVSLVCPLCRFLNLPITVWLVDTVAFFHHDFNSFDRQLCLPVCVWCVSQRVCTIHLVGASCFISFSFFLQLESHQN
jgi:hypothetical protein